MTALKTVMIGVQARSTSTRLPNKAFELVGDRMVLQHVLDACNNAAKYLYRHAEKYGYIVRVALLIPTGDPIGDKFRGRALIVQGSEGDVLGRYAKAAELINPDYIVRVTGDCPLIPPYLISKHVTIALQNKYDYVSNVLEDARTALDGADCEVISRNLLTYLDQACKDPYDREHVTTMARRAPPVWCRMGTTVGHFNLSGIKLSVDTAEDLENVRKEYESVRRSVSVAEERCGKAFVHRV